MLKGKIEKGVPFPARWRAQSTFFVGVIGFLGKLEVGDSALFEVERGNGCSFSTKISNILKVYRIIKNQDFTTEHNTETHTFRIWRTK